MSAQCHVANNRNENFQLKRWEAIRLCFWKTAADYNDFPGVYCLVRQGPSRGLRSWDDAQTSGNGKQIQTNFQNDEESADMGVNIKAKKSIAENEMAKILLSWRVT